MKLLKILTLKKTTLRVFILIILTFTFSCENDYSENSKKQAQINDTPSAFAKSIVKAFNNKDFNAFCANFITEEDYEYIVSKTHFNSKFSERMTRSTKSESIASNLKGSKTYFFNCHFKDLKYESIDYRLVRDQGGLLFTKDLEILALDEGESVKIIFPKLVKIEGVWKSANLFLVE
jgi:hypothetical protein